MCVVVVVVVHRGIIPTGSSGNPVLQRVSLANVERIVAEECPDLLISASREEHPLFMGLGVNDVNRLAGEAIVDGLSLLAT